MEEKQDDWLWELIVNDKLREDAELIDQSNKPPGETGLNKWRHIW